MPYVPPYLPGNTMMYTDQRFNPYDPYQQMQQQYQQNSGYVQINNQQQVTQNQQRLNGRFVNSPNDIAVNEVDMKGSVSIFPANDMSCIYAKQWTADGKIQTVKYMPVHEDIPEKGTQSAIPVIDYTPFMERFDRLEQLLASKTTNGRTKKGETENE